MNTQNLCASVGAVVLSACMPHPGDSTQSFHLGSWEKEIGYAQSVKIGNRLLVSGTTAGSPAPKDLPSQMKQAYEAIRTTLAHDGADFNNVIKETIYCRDMVALIAAQPLRKSFYRDHLPAATWVEVQRLYLPDQLIEIEVEAALP